MCVLYVRFGTNIRPRTFGCIDMGSAYLELQIARIFCRAWNEQSASCLDLV